MGAPKCHQRTGLTDKTSIVMNNPVQRLEHFRNCVSSEGRCLTITIPHNTIIVDNHIDGFSFRKVTLLAGFHDVRLMWCGREGGVTHLEYRVREKEEGQSY